MEVGTSLLWHVKVEDDVDLLDVNAATEELCCNEDAITELLEAFVDLQSIF